MGNIQNRPLRLKEDIDIDKARFIASEYDGGILPGAIHTRLDWQNIRFDPEVRGIVESDRPYIGMTRRTLEYN